MDFAPLRLSADARYLVDGAGAPFFFFADTAWSIVWKGKPEEWGTYLDRRVGQGFSVAQVNLLPWRWHLTDVEGNLPFVDGDPDRPNEAYFARFDRFLAMASERGLVTCLMILWGGPRPNLPAIRFTIAQAVSFARYAVARFGRHRMIWSLSGDAEYAREIEKWDAVGAAVEAADVYGHPTTNHLPPSMNWRFLHHDASWHDFHMAQTGHRRGAIGDIAALPAAYHRLPPSLAPNTPSTAAGKAFVNGEPWYEAHPSRDVREIYGPAFDAYDARFALWVSVLNGATMGHTYGAQGIWNWKRPGDDEEEMAGPQIGPLWHEALALEGAAHCGHAVRLLRDLPWWRLQPAPERVRQDPAPPPDHRPACARCPGELWVIYLPTGASRLTVLGLEEGAWRAAWFDPRLGVSHALGAAAADETGRWAAPPAPNGADWVLLLRRE